MNKPDVKPGQLVHIEWVDTKSLLGWTYEPEVKRTPGYICTTARIVQVNDECVTVTTSMDRQGASLDDLMIPLGAINSFKVIESVKVRAEDGPG